MINSKDKEENEQIIYKDIKDYEGLYQVSNVGTVRSLPRNTTKGKELKTNVNKYNGYCYVTLSKNNERKQKRVHKLVMMAFNPKPEGLNDLEIDHLDGNKQNNALDNLEWVTHKENIHRRGKYKDINYYSRPVIDLDTNTIFKTEKLAAMSVGGKTSKSVYRVCIGERNHYKGHRFAFYNNEWGEITNYD